MRAERLRSGEVIAGCSAVALLIVMLFSWFGIRTRADGMNRKAAEAAIAKLGDTTVTAWQAFTTIDVVLFATAVVAIAMLALAAGRQTTTLPVASTVVTVVLGLVSLLLVVIRIIWPPDAGLERMPLGDGWVVDVKLGALLGLLACAGIVVGALRAMRDERVAAIDQPPRPPAMPAPPPDAPTDGPRPGHRRGA